MLFITTKQQLKQHTMFSLQQSLSLEIVIGLLVDNVALAVLVLLLVVGLPGIFELLHLDLLPQRHGVLYVGHVGKVSSVRDPQTSHTVSMTPLCKVSLEGLGSLVGEVATNLAIVRDVQAVQLVQPVGDWLAIPAQGQVLGVVGNVIISFLLHLLLRHFTFRFLPLGICSCLLPLHVLDSVVPDLLEQFSEPVDLRLHPGNLLQLLSLLVLALARLLLGKHIFGQLREVLALSLKKALGTLLQSSTTLKAKSNQA